MRSYGELTLKGVLSDAIVKTIMRADAVDPQELEDMLNDIARKLYAGGCSGLSAGVPVASERVHDCAESG